VDTLSDLIRRSATAGEPGVEQAIFDTIDPVAMATCIEDLVALRLAPLDHALFYRPGVGVVAGLALVDGTDVVVKVHRWNVTIDRLAVIQRLQKHLAAAGLPAPRPLITPEPLGHGIVTAEELIVGQRADARDPSIRRAVAHGLHDFISAATDFSELAGLGTPLVLRSTHEPLWAEPHDVRFDFEATAAGAEWIDDLATTARARLQAVGGEQVAGHFDWRTENLGFTDGLIVAIYDWDSVCAAPEAVVVGNAAAQFCVDWTIGDPDPLPTPREMRAFVGDYERARGRRFHEGEYELLDAANLALCAYGARCQHSNLTLYPDLRGSTETGWVRLLRERGERWLIA
jgi:Ser/Thr protein kinase RdoA (MazF antagonist)